MIRPMVKIPHTIASPSIKGVQVHVIGTSTDCKPVGNLPQNSRCRPQPALLNLEEWPNADIIALLATPVAGISTSVAGIKTAEAIGTRQGTLFTDAHAVCLCYNFSDFRAKEIRM